jgi:hypothetical protein
VGIGASDGFIAIRPAIVVGVRIWIFGGRGVWPHSEVVSAFPNVTEAVGVGIENCEGTLWSEQQKCDD